MKKPEIIYLPDEGVDDALDQELRGLLMTCFTKPRDVVFRDRRYFREPYPHRWVMRNMQGVLIAHIGVHEKNVEAEGSTFRIGGICEVCVHPECRKQGYVRLMLECIHDWLFKHDYEFSVLFGNPLVYGSCGYVPVSNLFNGGGDDGWSQAKGMMKELSDTPWPSSKVLMPGPVF